MENKKDEYEFKFINLLTNYTKKKLLSASVEELLGQEIGDEEYKIIIVRLGELNLPAELLKEALEFINNRLKDDLRKLEKEYYKLTK